MFDFPEEALIFEEKSELLVPNPILSVWLLTYNHSRFISSALDSVLSQKVDFEYEIVIGDDFSSDNNREILYHYYKRHPDKIRLLLPEKNLWGVRGMFGTLTSIALYKACRGRYIAMLEGDDFWTDSSKLQKQIDYLENNDACSICTHWVKTRDESGANIDENEFANLEQPQILTSDDLFYYKGKCLPQGTCYHVLSWVFRRKLVDGIPDWVVNIRGGDHVLFIEFLSHGYCYCIPEFMGTYRVHGSSAWAPLHYRVKSFANLFYLYKVKKHYPLYRDRVVACIRKEMYSWKAWSIIKGELVLMREELKIMMRVDASVGILLILFLFKVIIYQLFWNGLSKIRIFLGRIRQCN